MSILSISVLAFVFVISIWALFPGLVIKYVNTKSFAKDVTFVLNVVSKIGDGQVVACLANVVAAYVVYRIQAKYFGK